ncbi:hypothetical protein, partial [Dyella sp.]|uniref:hypothetical protein n=1 Tax=Dyella sp. TaxID=1869338 RepID=UPI002B498F70
AGVKIPALFGFPMLGFHPSLCDAKGAMADGAYLRNASRYLQCTARRNSSGRRNLRASTGARGKWSDVAFLSANNHPHQGFQ